MKIKTNLFGKGQRVISDKYREGWDRIWGNKDKCKCDDPNCKCKKNSK